MKLPAIVPSENDYTYGPCEFRQKAGATWRALSEEQRQAHIESVMKHRVDSEWGREWLQCEIESNLVDQPEQFSDKLRGRWAQIFTTIEAAFKVSLQWDDCFHHCHFALGPCVHAPITFPDGKNPFRFDLPFAMMDWDDAKIEEYIRRTYEWLWEGPG